MRSGKGCSGESVMGWVHCPEVVVGVVVSGCDLSEVVVMKGIDNSTSSQEEALHPLNYSQNHLSFK